MAKIIDLNELVAEDIVLRYGRPVKEYRIPGDVSVDTVFTLFDAFTQLTAIEGDDPQQLADEVKRRFERIRDLVFGLLKERQPGLKEYPFGIRGTGAVLQVILSELGVNATAEDPTPPSPTPKRRTSAKSR